MSLTLRQIAVILRARWRLAALVAICILGAVTTATLLATPKYSATAAVILDVKSPDPIAGMVLPGMATSSYMGTQLDVVRSERVALHAIKALKLADKPEMREAWLAKTEGRGDYNTWLSDVLLLNLDVRPARESNVISVTYTSKDPDLSAAVANAFVQGYVDTTLDLRVDPAKQYNSLFDERARQLRETLEKSQAKLSAYERANGIIATDERLDIETMRLTELSSQLVTTQSLASESRSREAQSSATPDRMQEVLNNPVLANLTTDLTRQQVRFDELTSRLGDEHPQVQEMKSSIAQLRSRIAAETRRVSGSVTVSNNVNESRVATLRGALEEQRAKVLRLKTQRDEALVLSRDVENAQRAYDAMLTRLSQTNLETQTTQTNVGVLKRATPPAFPSSPRTRLNIAVGLVLALVVALAAAIGRELLDPRLRAPQDVSRLLGLTTLGLLPDHHKLKAGEGKTRLRLGIPARQAISG